MWVAPLFEGDGEVDGHVMWLQHDVYEAALRIMATTCQDYERYARSILNTEGCHQCVRSLDHRALQDAHDILAAVWRYRWELRVRQFNLPFEGETAGEPDFLNHWLAWLRDEVKSWLARPYLVRSILKILHKSAQPRRIRGRSPTELGTPRSLQRGRLDAATQDGGGPAIRNPTLHSTSDVAARIICKRT